MRPKNSIDVAPRKKKRFLGGKDERSIIEKYDGGFSLKKLSYEYDVSKSYLSNLLKRRNVKCRVNNSHLKTWTRIDNVDELKEGICGIYGLCFVNKQDSNDIKLYVGGSTNIKVRLKSHVKSLESNDHDSKTLQKYFDDDNYVLKLAIIKECDENCVMQEERVVQHLYNRSCLLNCWLACDENNLLPYLNKAITLRGYKNYTVSWPRKKRDSNPRNC
jgi:hypothetical protein